ncbi:MAG: glycogen/starch/alpha-glucan phosphorylase [Planctomycetota bacterium]|jgi:starch phosphorylase|nr:glycogen/starch/alpha-glucan phosphorylase [Planctomycetota bacterium]
MAKMDKTETYMRFDSRTRQGTDPQGIQLDYAEHLKYDLARDRYTSTKHNRFVALARAVRDRLIDRWIETQQAHHDDKVKRVYYLSLEFLMGRALGNNVVNFKLEDSVKKAFDDLGIDWEELRDVEVDAGLGNGGLGRLAACFLDSLATLQIPAVGYGLRYNYGIFRQTIDNGSQVEHPDDWLQYGNPWEIQRSELRIPVRYGGKVEQWAENGRIRYRWVDAKPVLGMAYDTPIVGYGGHTVNTLRLWSAHATEDFDFEDFNRGDYVESVASKTDAENLTKVLYPNDLHYLGKELRLKQQYLFVACSLWDIVRRFKHDKEPWSAFPDRVAVQMNDTHPSLAVPELMRLLIDQEDLDPEQAWDITVRSLGYTNHTLMPEALEKWPVPMMEKILPRHLQIIYDINYHFMQRVAISFPGDVDKLSRMSLIEESQPKQVRMANLCIVGSHSTNGVAALHTALLKSRVVPDFADMYPERFNSKTNGITQRRWLLKSNPALANLITAHVGDKWVVDLDELRKLEPLAGDSGFREKFVAMRREAKLKLVDQVKREIGFELNPDSIFDTQVKRLHEYKRQLMNALHIIMLYSRLRKNPNMEWTPQTFLFGAKAAPGYEMAKLIIKLINNVANVVNNDPVIGDRLKVYFLPNYRVSLAEKIIPATDVSEQISTAGTEASGTGNMKFMLNGAVTIGTLDGANIEILEEVGKENIYIFGLNADEAKSLSENYDPYERYQANPEIKEALDLLFGGHFSVGEGQIFEPIRKSLLEWGDRYLLIADLPSYSEAHQAIQRDYRDTGLWMKKSILNTARSGKFSSDRTILEYAKEIWHAAPHPLDTAVKRSNTIIEAKDHTREID